MIKLMREMLGEGIETVLASDGIVQLRCYLRFEDNEEKIPIVTYRVYNGSEKISELWDLEKMIALYNRYRERD